MSHSVWGRPDSFTNHPSKHASKHCHTDRKAIAYLQAVLKIDHIRELSVVRGTMIGFKEMGWP